jgi:methionyl-tRNA formyltransferase
MRVAFFGTPDFAVPTLQAMGGSRHQVSFVVSRPDMPVGRKMVMTSPPIVELAREIGLEVMQPANLKGDAVVKAMVDHGIEAAVVVAYGRLIPAAMLELPRFGFINLHPSLLPRHRGPSPIQWALVCGDRTTGVTTMQLDEGMDTGPILLQERVSIEETDTSLTLSPRLAEQGAALVVATLDGLELGEVRPRPQPSDGVNVTPMLRRGFGEIDWTMPAQKIVNRFRGFTPWPGIYTEFRGARLKILGIEEVDTAPTAAEEPGTVIDAAAEGIVVRCGKKTAVRLTELQREGKKRIPADAFLIGERVVRGERLG